MEHSTKNHVKTPKEQAEKLKKEGNTEFCEGNFDAAIVYYTQALSMCPKSEKELLSILFQNRAAAYSKLDNIENCVADCNIALVLVPTYKKALYRRAEALVKLGNLKLALEDVLVLIVLDEMRNKDDMAFAFSLLTSLGQQNLEEYKKNNTIRFPKKALIEKYLKLFYDDPLKDEYPQKLMKSDVNTGLELALKCIRDKNYEGVEGACKDELNKINNSVIRRTLALHLRGTFIWFRCNYDAALEHFTNVIETPGVSNKLVFNSLIKRGLCYLEKRQTDKSLDDFKRAEQMYPSSYDVFYHRSQVYITQGNYEKTIIELKKAIALNPTFMLTKVKLYFVQYIWSNGSEKYSRKLRGLIDKYPDYQECYILLAQALIHKGRNQEADSLCERVHKMYPKNASFLLQRAMIAVKWKNSKSDAFKFIEQALKIDPTFVDAYDLKANLYMKMGKFNESIESEEKALHFCIFDHQFLGCFMTRNLAQAHVKVANRLDLTMDSINISL